MVSSFFMTQFSIGSDNSINNIKFVASQSIIVIFSKNIHNNFWRSSLILRLPQAFKKTWSAPFKLPGIPLKIAAGKPSGGGPGVPGWSVCGVVPIPAKRADAPGGKRLPGTRPAAGRRPHTGRRYSLRTVASMAAPAVVARSPEITARINSGPFTSSRAHTARA